MFRVNFGRDESGMLRFVSGNSRPKKRIAISVGYQFSNTVTVLITKEEAQSLIDALQAEITPEADE